MTASQIAVALADRRGEDWSAGDAGVDVAAVSLVAMELARSLLRQSPDPTRRRYAAETEVDLLRVLGVVGLDGGLTRAGELLFVPPPQPADDLVYQYRRTPRR